MRLGKILSNNFWPKVIALVLAIATWFYVIDLVDRDSFSQKKESMEEVMSRYKFMVKKVPVKPAFFGKSPKGYKVLMNDVVLDPPSIVIFGPEKLISEIEVLSTDNINLAEYTRTVKLRLGIQSGVKALQLKNKWVDVYLPVEAVKEKE